jgi:transposase InsO family protein
LYLWQQKLRQGEDLSALTPKSQAPKVHRKRKIEPKIIAEITRLRMEVCRNLGKDKVKVFLDVFCEAEGFAKISSSTIGRIIKDKKIYHIRTKYFSNGKSKVITKRKKDRKPKELLIELPGDFVEIDTIVKFSNKIKRYIITAVDVHGRVAFAWCYNRAGSHNARDFLHKLELALPFAIKTIQTDNGSEFCKYFDEELKNKGIKHYWNYPGRPYRNGHIEKFNRTIQEEFIDQNEIWLEDTTIFNKKMLDWLLWYNTQRPHWSLRLQSPVDYLINNSRLSKMSWTDTFYFPKSLSVL